ncbi:MAG TPA: type II toxin-antitoxin system HicB family antitoxin [Ktedonosporobacter sp.]|nr:type II toxin-antitoxin system HicB family antitoxin [Ktedonosporobacter sp.]
MWRPRPVGTRFHRVRFTALPDGAKADAVNRVATVRGTISKFSGGRRGNEQMRLTVVLEPSEEGGYTIYVPALPGCISEGETKEEALANIKEAIKLYLEPVEAM